MRPLKVWEKNYCGSDDPEVIQAIFRRRYRVAQILFILGFFGNFALNFISISVFGMSKERFMQLGLHYFALFIPIAALYILFRYRCPRCNAVPTSNKIGTSGILLFPKQCGNCGAPLLYDHRWAQD